MNNLKDLRVCLLFFVGFLLTSKTALSQDIHANIQNDAVSRYLNEVTYTAQEDSSCIDNYLVNNGVCLDVPQPVFIEISDLFKKFIRIGNSYICYSSDDSFKPQLTDTVNILKKETGVFIYDLQPGVEYFYRLYIQNAIIAKGKLTTEGPVRMIYLPSVRNVRDLGGWKTSDGRTIRYGKLIRGSELNGMHTADAADMQHLLNLGVSAELDLRANWEDTYGVRGVSAFGFKSAADVEAGEVPSYLYTNDSGQILDNLKQYLWLQRWRNEFNFIVQNLRVGRTIYFHCRWGADRTGYLSLLLEGLLGVPYDGLVKDYELSSFALLDKKKEIIDPVIEFIRTIDGKTLQEKFNTFWTKRVGVKQEDINYFIDEMLEGEKKQEQIESSIITLRELPIGMNYNLQGRRISSHQRGLVIQRQQDGSVRKMVK